MKMRKVFQDLLIRLKEPRRFIQCLIGPRQVGKTTLAHEASDELGISCLYTSADLATLQNVAWLEQKWEAARELAKGKGKALLIVDEVQKILHWSDVVKFLWDQDSASKINLSVLLLGSSPWLAPISHKFSGKSHTFSTDLSLQIGEAVLTEHCPHPYEEKSQSPKVRLSQKICEKSGLMQKGLSESLTGRFEIMPITHWSYSEMQAVFGWSLEHYLYFGGYPGAAPFSDEKNPSRWISYINDSIIETTISRDILLMSQINKPVLLRRLFQLGCHYSGQILSYNKMLGELQDVGNSTTLAHYLDLLSKAGVLAGLQKYANQNVRRKGSSPKFVVYNTALLSAQSGKSFLEAKGDHSFWGRLIESAVGAHLINGIRGTQIELFYWREGDQEVDFVLKYGDKLIAIEVKSTRGSFHRSGIDSFQQQFKPFRILLIGDNHEIPLEKFLSLPPNYWFD